MIIEKIRNFYVNKYLISPFSGRRYFISYDFRHKALWFRNYKVATRSIDHHLKSNCKPGEYIYSSAVGYNPAMYKNYFKFAFVRNPVGRFVSAWKDKVLKQNYFKFPAEQHQDMKNIGNFIGWVEQRNLEICDEHLRAQYALIDLNNVDFLGRFEKFEEDFSHVAKTLEFKSQPDIKLNTTQEIKTDISNANHEDILKLYEKDVRLFYPELI